MLGWGMKSSFDTFSGQVIGGLMLRFILSVTVLLVMFQLVRVLGLILYRSEEGRDRQLVFNEDC